MVANILPAAPPSPDPKVGSMCQNLTFSEHGNVVYQFKENRECPNMVANILLIRVKVKIIFFTTLSCCRGIINAATWQHIFPPPPHNIPDPQDQKVQILSKEHGHVAYQIKGNRECNNMAANILPVAPSSIPDPGDSVLKSNFNFFIAKSCCISN